MARRRVALKNDQESDDRGGALLEGVAATGVVFVFTSALLVATYLLFARAYLQYESEQALLCLAESRPAFICKRILLDRLAKRLPWGDVSRARLAGGEDAWRLEVEWAWQACRLRVRKDLSVGRISGRAGSRSSGYSR